MNENKMMQCSFLIRGKQCDLPICKDNLCIGHYIEKQEGKIYALMH